jgi:hypothetical protein
MEPRFYSFAWNVFKYMAENNMYPMTMDKMIRILRGIEDEENQ